jgi:cyanophycin synthetase
MLKYALQGLTLICWVQNTLRRQSAEAVAMGAHRSVFYDQIWRDAAAHEGCTFTPLGFDIAEVRRGDRSIRVTLNFSPLDDSVTLRLAGHKPTVYKILADEGVPVPRHIAINCFDLKAARAFLRSSTRPVVVKPASGTGGGAGVTTNITDTWRLMRALAQARSFGGVALIEEQIEGNNYRLLYLDGEMIDAVERKPPSITGDGTSSIGTLVRRENALRVKTGPSLAQALLHIDVDMRHSLEAQGKSLRTVPAKGEIVRVKTVINGNRAEENEPAFAQICESTVAMGRRVVERLGIRLAGVDIITSNPGIDLANSGGVVIDVNTTPGHYYHYLKKGHEFQVAIAILRAALGETYEAKAASR